MDVLELAPGLWQWTAPHPDWSPELGWPQEVGCFYAEAPDATILVDPLVPAGEEERFWRALDGDVERRGLPVVVLLTCGAHVRSAHETAARYGAEVWGHKHAGPKVGGARFRAIRPGDVAAGDVRVLGAEAPAKRGTPLYLPSHRALAVGDALIAVDGLLRIWWAFEGEEDERLFHERYLPALRSWLALDVEHVLVAHGEQLPGGRELLAAALDRPPYERL